MAKKKNSPALFEVIARDRERQSQAGLNVPTWMGGRKQQDSAEEQSSQESPAPQQPKQPKAPQQQPKPAPKKRPKPDAAPADGKASDEPMFSTSGGRLRVSLNYSSAIIASVALVLLLGAAFAIGRATADGDAATAAATGVIGEQEAGREMGSGADRQPGKHYLVIWDADESSGLEDEAERIARFFTEQGEPAEVTTLEDRQAGTVFVAVWALEGFDRPDSQAAENYATRIRELGREYRNRHTNISINPWYAEYQPPAQ